MTLNLTKGIFLGPAADEQTRALGTRSSVLRGNSLLRTLESEELSSLISEGQWVRFQTGKAICRPGAPAHHAWFLVEGRAKAEVAGVNGNAHSAVVDFFGPGDAIGLLSLVDGAPHAAAFVAVEEVLALAVPLESLRTLLQGHAEWYRVLAEMAVSRIRAGDFWLQAIAS
jgi:CRP-like cAMP-binding protein